VHRALSLSFVLLAALHCGGAMAATTVAIDPAQLRAQRLMHERDGEYRAAFDASQALIEATTAASSDPATRTLDLINFAADALPLGELDSAQRALDEALRLAEQHALTPQLSADVYTTDGAMLMVRGDWRAAQQRFEHAASLLQKGDAHSMQMLRISTNLGLVALNRGDLARARLQLDAALSIAGQRQAAPLVRARILHTLAQVDYVRGDLAGAAQRFEQAAALERDISREAPMYATTLLGLAATAARLGRNDIAAGHYAEALSIFEKRESECRCLGPALLDIGYFDLSNGRHALALQRFQRARDLIEASAPDSLLAASTMRAAAEAHIAADQWREAAQQLNDALAIEQKTADNTTTLAATRYLLGRVSEVLAQPQAARRHYCAAADVLDRVQIPFAGENYSQARFRAQFDAVYGACLRAELRAKRIDAAFSALERSRARGFLNTLQERDLELQSRSGALATGLLGRQRPLDAAAARASLPAGAIAISFDVGENDTFAFVVTRERIRAAKIDLGEVAMRQEVDRFRALIENGTMAAVRDEADKLHALLLTPLQAELDNATRVLISPDAALHELPFAALWDDQKKRWLIEQAPIAIIDSLSTRAAILGSASRANQGSVLAVGEPLLAARAGDASERSALVNAQPPLPGARAEVALLRQRFGARAHILTGSAATEAAVKSQSGNAETLHFAVHAIYDSARPSQSALLLAAATGSDADDGLLHIWEVFEQMRLNAELIVLSACETARGEQFSGEGLLGFSRAFHFAGARNVLATLWRIEDTSTADLMRSFYAAPKTQTDPAAALRSAMLKFIGNRDSTDADTARGVGGIAPRDSAHQNLAHPYHWAGFQVY
jgi:CHAT domain-containing protein/Tfp pilus assembly protein PilF